MGLEDRRSPVRFASWRLVAAVLIASFFFVGWLAYTLSVQRSEVQHNCVRINRLEDALNTILRTSRLAQPDLIHDLRLLAQARCIN
jgi:hypothetical protein